MKSFYHKEIPDHVGDETLKKRKKSLPSIDKRTLARQMYMGYDEPVDIANKIGSKPETVWQWIRTLKWDKERAAQFIAASNVFLEKQVNYVAKIQALALPIIHETIMNAASNGEIKTLQDARALTEIATSLDKLMRLSLQQPTDHVEVSQTGFTIADIKKALEKDKFIELIQGEADAIYRADTSGAESLEGDSDQVGSGEERSGGDVQGSPKDPFGEDL